MKRNTRQGAYILIAGRTLYAGSVAGKQARTFDRRLAEHLRQLAAGTHPNDALRRQFARDGSAGWVMIPVARVRPGDIATARRIERAIIKALKGVCCNERG